MAPRINRVIETGIYCSDLDTAEAFYGGILGLTRISRHDGRDLFYAVGDTVLLIFVPEATSTGRTLPAHGAEGPGHFALQIDPKEYDAWAAHLRKSGVEIEREHGWDDWVARSLFFRDPAGNLVELITRPAWEEHFKREQR